MSARTNNFSTSTLTRHAETILIQGSNFNIKKSTDIARGNVSNKESLAMITAMKAVYFFGKGIPPSLKVSKNIRTFQKCESRAYK